MQQYFVKKEQIENDVITILGEDVHHIKNVMRMKFNNQVIISDEEELILAEITDIREDLVVLKKINSLDSKKELPIKVTIAQGMVRREKMEEVVDYISELGATNYLPVIMERSLNKLSKADFNKKLDRLNKIAKEASEQSHRLVKLECLPLVDFSEFLSLASEYDLAVVAYEKCDVSKTLNGLLKDNTIHNMIVLVGPEGGVSEKELKELVDHHFIPVSLGPRILRTQVAPLYIMSAISNIFEGGE